MPDVPGRGVGQGVGRTCRARGRRRPAGASGARGKRGRGAPLAPAGIGDDAARFRSRRSVGAYVRCALRHRCKGPTRVQRGCPSRNDTRRGSGKRRQRRQKRRQRQGCRRLRRVAVGGGGGCRQRAMPPQDAPLQRLPPQRRVTTPPLPGTARAPGRGRSALRRALSTAGTRSIPAGGSAP